MKNEFFTNKMRDIFDNCPKEIFICIGRPYKPSKNQFKGDGYV